MQYEVFTIPVLGGSEESERMNRFLRGHKVVQVDRQFLVLGDCAYWSFCVNYLESAAPVSVVVKNARKWTIKMC